MTLKGRSTSQTMVCAMSALVAIGAAWAVKAHFDAIEPGEYVGPSLPPSASIPHTGQAVPVLTLTDLTGAQQQVGGPAVRPRLVHIWASWCLPCVAELPSFQAAQQDFQARGIDLVTIAMDDRDHAQEVVDRLHLTLRVLVPEGTPVDPTMAFGSSQGSVPYNALIDTHGTLARRKVGTMERGAVGVLRWLDGK